MQAAPPIPEPEQEYREPEPRWEPEPDRYREREYREPERYREPQRYREPEYRERYREPEPPPRDDYPPRRERWRPRGGDGFGPGADTLGRVIQIFTGLVALAFLLHIVFVVTEANQGNDFVSFTYGVAKVFVFGLGDVFTPEDATIGVVLNYGLAAIIWLFAGRIVGRALKR